MLFQLLHSFKQSRVFSPRPNIGNGGTVHGSAVAGQGGCHCTHERATFTISRCTVQEAVIQSLHRLSRGEGKAKEEEHIRESLFSVLLPPTTCDSHFRSLHTRSPLRLLFFPSELSSFVRSTPRFTPFSLPLAHHSLTSLRTILSVLELRHSSGRRRQRRGRGRVVLNCTNFHLAASKEAERQLRRRRRRRRQRR